MEMETQSCLEIGEENSLNFALLELKLTDEASVKSDFSSKEEPEIQHEIAEESISRQIEENAEENVNRTEEKYNEEFLLQENAEREGITEKDVDNTVQEILTTVDGKNISSSVEIRNETGQEPPNDATKELVLLQEVMETTQSTKNNISAFIEDEIELKRDEDTQTPDSPKDIMNNSNSSLCENNKAIAVNVSNSLSDNNMVILEQKAATYVDDKIDQDASTHCDTYSSLTKLDSNDVDEAVRKITDDSLAEKILRQVEFYFSDFNLLKNYFLLKHIKKSKDGFVSLKMISTFRKVRLLTKDMRVVAYSLMRSDKLELNETNTKIRRKEPVPKVRDISLGKTIIAFNLPLLCPTSENLKDLFSKFGRIATAEVMTSKSENFNVYHRRCVYRNKELASKTFGAIEFEKYEDAISALKDEDSYLPKENKMNVVPLTAQIHKSFFRRARNQHFSSYNRRGGTRFSSKSNFQTSQMNRALITDGDAKGKPWNGEKNYRRYYSRQVPRNIQPSDTKSVKKFSSDTHLCCEKKSAFRESRQLKTNNSINISKALDASQTAQSNRQPFAKQETSHH